MFFVADVLAVLAGLFYAAAHHEIGSLGVEMCRYGDTFCDNPFYMFLSAPVLRPSGAHSSASDDFIIARVDGSPPSGLRLATMFEMGQSHRSDRAPINSGLAR